MSILIYSKLDPASGNATSAARLADFFEPGEKVIRRDIAPELPEDPAAQASEVAALRQLAADEQLTLAIGIHCYRAGAVLREAFAGTLPYLLIASGTDLNVAGASTSDLQKNPRHATLRDAIAHSAGVVALSPDLHAKADAVLTEVPKSQRPPLVLIPQAPDIASGSTYSLRAALGLSPAQKLVLLPAGIRPVKGIAFAIEAMAQAMLDHPEHVLVILGPPLDPDYHAHCASLIGEWRLRHRTLKGRLQLLAGLPRADYLAALREADLLLNTSESEGLSNAILEALGAGVPVLARDIPGNRAIIADEHNGLIFDRLPAFLRQYARLFADRELRQRLIANGQSDYRTRCNADTEKASYLALVALARNHQPQRITLPSGDPATLLMAPGTHILSAANLALFSRLASDPPLSRHRPRRLLDVGCGSGVFGWVATDLLARDRRRFDTVDFIDNDPASVIALRCAIEQASDWWAARSERVRAFAGDLFAALPDSEPHDLILANLPQTPAPQPIANDRFGGSGDEGGAGLLLRFMAQLPRQLAPGGIAYCTHIGLANPPRVSAAIAAAGLVGEVVAEEVRRLAAADYDALAPGLADYLIDQAGRGHCELSVEKTANGRRIVFPVRLIRLRHAADC